MLYEIPEKIKINSKGGFIGQIQFKYNLESKFKMY